MNKYKQIIIIILIVVFIIGVGVAISYADVTNRETFNVKVENVSPIPVETVSQEKNSQSYYKVIDNTKLELEIPNDWKYEEMPKNEEHDFYKYALKLYKNNENEYAILYFYNNQFGVCGTARTEKDITLDNGKEANIGYYDANKNWSDISFYSMNKNVAVINEGLINDEAEELIDFIKTINITESNL